MRYRRWALFIAFAFVAASSTHLAADEPKFEELRISAAQLAEWGECRNVRYSADGPAIELDRGVLIEDDGPGAGYSYQPNEEPLGGDIRILKELVIDDPRAAQATLLVGPGGELTATVNGALQQLKLLGKAGNYWQRYELPVESLHAGANQFVLSGQGKVWIARAEDFAAGSITRPQHPNRSRRSSDGGKTWSDSQLGLRGDIDGEYCVRLFLDQHHPTGSIVLPVADVTNLGIASIAPPAKKFGPVQVELDAERGDSGDVVIYARSGTTYVPSETNWTAWQTLAGDSHEIAELRGRFLQLKLELSTRNPLTSPRVRRLMVSALRPPAPSWIQGRPQNRAEIARTSIPFEYESCHEASLAKLRREQRLDEVTADAKTEWELVCRLAAWASKQFESGHLSQQYPPWDANEILKPHADGKPVGGFCQQYNLTFLQACESFGLVGRAVSIGAGDNGVNIRSGHEVVEIWSNEFNKWVYIDGQAAWYFLDEALQVPLSLRELRDRQLKALAGKPYAKVQLVRVAPTKFTWNNLTEWPAFCELRMIPRSNFLAAPSPLPLNQGMRGWFWTGHYVWTDSQSPASFLYGNRVTLESNWDWTINRTKVMLVASETEGELRVYLDTQTPNFKTFRATFADGQVQDVEREFVWELEPGSNSLKVWAVNQADRAGAVTNSSVTVSVFGTRK